MALKWWITPSAAYTQGEAGELATPEALLTEK